MASRENDRPTAVTALVYAFYVLVVVFVVVCLLWLLGVVPGWVVPAVLVLTALVFILLWRALSRFRQTLSSSPPSEGPPV